MEKVFVSRFMESNAQIKAAFSAKHPGDYTDIVRAVVSAIQGDACDDAPSLDPARIHIIDDGDYQGTLLYVIGAQGYQPSEYWSVFVSYGSCSGCDTLESIKSEGPFDSDTPTAEQVAQYMSLALHIVQGLKRVGEKE